MNCTGIDLVHPVDRMPDGAMPYIQNCRVVQEGRIDARPGYTPFIPAALPTALHSIRRLNDPDDSVSSNGYAYVVGDSTLLYAGIESALAQVDTGYSGNPLALINFRPDQSPASWMYVYDQNKLVKINAAGTIRSVGLAPPNEAPNAQYGVPAYSTIVDGQDTGGPPPTGWSINGASATAASATRVPGGITVSQIQYLDGRTNRWCVIVPSGGAADWAGQRMNVVLAAGTGNAETVGVREIHNAIAATTVAAIQYDAGTSGACSIVLTNNSTGLAQNSVLLLNGVEYARVQSVVLSPNGTTYSIRCSTVNTIAAGNSAVGATAWYVFTILTHVAGESVTGLAIEVAQATGAAVLQNIGSRDTSIASNGRPIDPANDWFHVSILLGPIALVTSLKIQVDIDPATALGSAPFTGNYWEWDFSQADLIALGAEGTAAGPTWLEITKAISSGTRFGGNPALGFSTTEAVAFTLTTTGTVNWGFDWFYFFGTYGPVIQPNSPIGYVYSYRNRDSTTGTASVPGPATRYQLFPLRESIAVFLDTSNTPGLDYFDIYRDGGTITDFVYVGSVQNNVLVPQFLIDGLSDASVAGNATVDLTQIQPWPVLAVPRTGIVNVIGTSVVLVSGNPFDLTLLANTVILLNGAVYQTFGQPISAALLQLTTDAGVQNGIPYAIDSPTLAGQPLAYAFGPLEGPLTPVVFALGDPVSGGNLYFSNSNSADGASDQNFIELCPPSEPLISGDVWNGIVICGSRDDLFLVRYAYLQTSQYQFSRIPSASGIWSRWACCRGPNGVYFLGRDGIYLATESQAVCITDEQLYPIFPHDGQSADTAGVNGIFPVDMTQLTQLRLSCCDRDIYFDYIDILGNPVCLRYEIAFKRWLPHFYGEAQGIAKHYLVELPAGAPNQQQILLLGRATGLIYIAGGNQDNGKVINSVFQMPSVDGGDQRAQKLYVDAMTDAAGTGTLEFAAFYDNDTNNSVVFNLPLAGVRRQFQSNLSEIAANLQLYRNISPRYAWTGGPDGPKVYAWEPSGYVQPYLSTQILTQFINLSFQGWKHMRRMYPGIISTADVMLLILTDDGRSYGPFTIPSTGGRYKIQQQMLSAGIKALAFAFEVTSTDLTKSFAFFPDSFTIETKEWKEPDYLSLSSFKA